MRNSPQECVDKLVESGDIPHDSVVVSTNNKIVVVSRSEGIVTRIREHTIGQERDDPHDLQYSHRVAWLASRVAPVVKPLHESPLIRGEFILSSYPLFSTEHSLSERQANNIYDLIKEFGDALHEVSGGMNVRRIDIHAYVQDRLITMHDNGHPDPFLVDFVSREVERLALQFPFSQLVEDDTSLIHGDVKSENIVFSDSGDLIFIDVDAAAAGPRLYDLASWMLRSAMGDAAPVNKVVEVGRQQPGWDEETYRSLIGWKAVSSMSFTLRYEPPEVYKAKFKQIRDRAFMLGGFANSPMWAS